MAGIAFVLALLGVPAALVVAGVFSPRFDPAPELEWARRLVMAAVGIASTMLLYSLTTTWYVAERPDRNTVGNGDSGLVQFVVVASLVTGGLIVGAVCGRRNWSPLALLVTWSSLAVAWFDATFPGWLEDRPQRLTVEAGLQVATWSVLVLTGTAFATFLVRSWELNA